MVTASSSRSTLLITSLMTSDLGNISCTADDPLHPLLSKFALVVETSELYLLGDRRGQTQSILEGSPLVLECPVRARSESTLVKWFAGNVQLMEGVDGVRIQTSDNGSSVITLPRAVTLDRDDRNRYLCVVRDGTVELQYEIELYVTSE